MGAIKTQRVVCSSRVTFIFLVIMDADGHICINFARLHIQKLTGCVNFQPLSSILICWGLDECMDAADE